MKRFGNRGNRGSFDSAPPDPGSPARALARDGVASRKTSGSESRAVASLRMTPRKPATPNSRGHTDSVNYPLTPIHYSLFWHAIEWHSPMAKLDELASKGSSPSLQSVSQRPISRLGRHWDLLALLLLVLASSPAVWLSPRSLVVVRDTSLIDDNWHLDEVFKLSRRIWIGRDVAFTHGPIFQWLSSLPARSMGVSMGAIYATWFTVPVWCAFAFVYLTLRLLLPEQPAWKRALLLLLMLIFWEPSLSNAFPVLLFAIFLRGWYAVIAGRAKPYALGIVAALLCVIAFLVASDTGVYSTAAWVLAAAAVLEARRDKPIVGKCSFTLVAFALSAFVLALAVNSAMGPTFDFRFWKDCAQMVSVYRWATPAAMTGAGTVHLLGTLFAGAAVFLFRAGARSRQNPATAERTGFLLGGFAFAVVMLQSALVRSDLGHVVIAAFAMVCLSGTILFSFEKGGFSAFAVLLAIACSMLFSRPAFRPSTVIRLVAQVWHPLAECPAGFREFDRSCFAPEFAAMLQSASSYLGQHSGPQDHIVVFPYQTKFGIVSRRDVAGGLMQAYTASGPYLSQLEIAGLERTPSPAGLYLPDADMRDLSDADLVHWRNLDLSLPVDGTYSFTRTPEVWFWMLQHYRAEQQLSPGVFGLQRDDSRASRISMQPQTLGLAAQTYTIRERISVVDLGVPDWPPGADFLRVRLTVRYGFWWKLRKPERMQVEITRADGSSELRWFVLQPNVSTEVWFYPWSPPELIHYLDADESHWRITRRPAITRLRLWATPLDWISATPGEIVVEAADAVRLEMNQ